MFFKLGLDLLLIDRFWIVLVWSWCYLDVEDILGIVCKLLWFIIRNIMKSSKHRL
jgi:hypothetical protein